jgi:hypothetical protein
VTCYRIEGTRGCGGIPLLPEGTQGYPSCKIEKVFRESIIQGASFIFRKDGNLFIFDLEDRTVTFSNITFPYGHIVSVVVTLNILPLQRKTE